MTQSAQFKEVPAATSPLVTIGLPVYNGERFLGACLDSLLAQTYANFEIVISDNASTDSTPAICADYATQDDRIRVVHAARNVGSARNHNRVLSLAQGTFFKWSGADDLIDPRHLETCVDILQERPDYVGVYPRSVLIDQDGKPIERTTSRLPLDSTDPVERFQCLLGPMHRTHNVFYGLHRLSMLRKARGLGIFIGNDTCLVAELSLMGPLYEVPDYLIFRRIHAGNNLSVEDQFRLYAPEAEREPDMPYWRRMGENFRSVVTSESDFRLKVRLARAVASWAFDNRAGLRYEAARPLARFVRRFRKRRHATPS